MRYSDPIDESGLNEEINRICGTTNAIYSNKAKVARINDALDSYYNIARGGAINWNFDDHDNTSPPIEYQNIVSGTNRYKFSSFTSEILDLLRIAILDDDADGHELIYEDFGSIDNFQEKYLNTTDVTGIPQYYTKYGDFIYLRPTPDYSETNGLQAFFNRPISKYTFESCTMSVSTDLITDASHGLSANDTVIFETDGTLPTNLTADTVNYYVISEGLTTDVFEVSTSLGGSKVDLAGSPSGNHKYLCTSDEPPIPSIHHMYLARHASLPFLVEKNIPHAQSIASLLQKDEMSIRKWFATRGRDESSKITMKITPYV